MRPKRGFTLVELLTVMAIIAVLATIMLPAIGQIRQRAVRDAAARNIQAIVDGVKNYEHDFGDYPPSEPDAVDPSNENVPGGTNSAYYGAAGLFFYLNGDDGHGYRVGVSYNSSQKTLPPRVSGMKVLQVGTYPTRYNFADPWGNGIEYFRAYKQRGITSGDIYPRAVDYDAFNYGTGYYKYVFNDGSGQYVGGRNMHIPVVAWLNGYSDYTSGWQANSKPVNASSFLVVSQGPDNTWGSPDDVGNWR